MIKTIDLQQTHISLEQLLALVQADNQTQIVLTEGQQEIARLLPAGWGSLNTIEAIAEKVWGVRDTFIEIEQACQRLGFTEAQVEEAVARLEQLRTGGQNT